MIKAIKKALTVALALMLCVGINAQNGKYFNNERQLSSSFVTQVYKDRQGYLWITTRDGINRYDGYQFRVFKKENAADSTLASNYVNSIMQDSHGTFYFGMYGALQTWDGNTFNHVRMKDLEGNEGHCYASCFLERRNGDVLAGTSGLGVMRFTSKETAQQMGGPLASLHTVRSLMEDSRDRLWLAADSHGLMCLDGNDTICYLTERNDLYGLCEDKLGNIYVGTSNAGVFKLSANSCTHLEGTGQNAVSALYCDSEGMIMIGYDGNGVAIYDPWEKTLTDNPFYSMEVDLAKSKVLSFAEDGHGNIWIGMLEKGIYKQPVGFRGFHYMGHKMGPRNMIGNAFIICTFVDSKGRIWLGTDKDGLYCLSPDMKEVRHLSHGYPSVVMAVNEDSEGRIWIGSYQDGFGWIDAAMNYHRQPFPENEHLIVMDICTADEGKLWMASLKYGLMCMDLTSGEIKAFTTAPGADSDRQVNSITNDYASQLSLSPDGQRMYVSTSMGLCCLDIESGSWTKTFGQNCLNYSQPARVAKELDGKLWLATNNGLYCYTLDGKETAHYVMADGLADNGVASIEQDEKGRLWLGTNHGLSCLDTKTGAFQNYYTDDGVQSNEFGDNSSFKDRMGTIYMGGTGGLTWFNPRDIVHTKWKASVHITDFFINGIQMNRDTRSGGRLVTDTTVMASNTFRLSYHDNSFAIQLSTLTFENPEHTSYLYSINGEPFIRLQNGTNVITFSHVQPGTYDFRVKAERDNLTTEERTFTVIVDAPWYKTAWAYTLYILIALALLALLGWNRRRKEQTRLRMQEHIHAKDLADAKLKFFMNISHEIRTPMTLIVTPLMSLIKEEKDPQHRAVLQTIKRNAERILGLVNQMMDIRKIDKGEMQMRMRETDLVVFLNDIYSLFHHQAQAKQIKLVMEHDCDKLPIWIDRKNFDKVIMNILSNAFKFTPAGGEIRISVTHDSQQARIAISDSGEKIPEDKLGLIFKRFYQSPSQVNDRHAGTGIGLDLTRSLVELHHGTIEAHNLEKGCEFTVTLPLGNAHLRPEEIVTEEEVADTPAAEDNLEETVEEEKTAEVKLRRKGDKKVIVLAEDDDEIRQYLATELGTDYDVRACANGREALGETYRTMPDLVLSDIMMPEMDGNTLCSKLKGNQETSHIPVIMLTAKNSDEDRLEGLETGADAYIVKPFNMDILRHTIVNLISTRQQLQQKYTHNDKLVEQVKQVELAETPDERLMAKIMDTINSHIDDSDLSVDIIAEEAGISRVHLHRKMKDITGQTPHDFIRNIRLKRAATMLASGTMNVTEVMFACGFSNSTSFSTIFKKVYGMSPREYIKEHNKKE